MSSVYTPSGTTDEGTSSIEYCNSKWTEAMTLCEGNLSEPEHAYLEKIKCYQDFKQNVTAVEKSLARPASSTLLQRIAPVLDPLTSFVTLMTACLSGSAVETALVWGLMSLLLRAASQTDDLLPDIVEMLQELGHDLEIFQVQGVTFARNPRIGDELIDIFVDIIVFWTQTIHFLNRNKHHTTAQRSWPNVRKKFEDTLRRIRKRAEQIKEKASAAAQVQIYSQADLLMQLDRLGLLTGSVSNTAANEPEGGPFPCSNIPFARNTHFYGREEELNEIRKHLDHNTATVSFRSFALYGTGGIGKTQTALCYAYKQKDAGTEAILWFNCETGLSLSRSFADAAALLQLEGASEDETSEQNKLLVLRWLRRTARTWLCVFDDVEDLNIFRNAWPVADSGKILVTSRNDIVSIDPAAGGIEIKVFDEEKGVEMVLQQVGRPKYDDSEIEAARQLTNRLGGLALALVVMSSQIRLKRMTIAKFVNLYEKHAAKLNKELRGVESYYKFSLATCWQTTFTYLSNNANMLLGIIAYLGSDALPEELFHPADPSVLPDDFQFCSDDWEFGEALEELLSTSVVRKDPMAGLLFIHRLTQEEFRNFMGADRQRQAFSVASTLLCEAFPKLILGQSMRLHWKQCKMYIQHVLILCARWRDSKFMPDDNDDFAAFLLLSTACGWYLMESGAWQEEIELMDVAMTICEDKESLTYAILANSRGGMETERAHCKEAYKYMTPSLAIVRRVYGDSHPEVGNGFNNYANIVLQELQEGACEKAIEYYFKALEIFQANGPEVYTRLFHIPHTNLARAYRILKQYDKAIYHAEQSRKWAVGFLGEGCHFDGLAEYHVGNALFDLGQYDKAELYWLRALELFSRENETHPTTNAAKIKLSTIKMKRGDFEEAISMLQMVLLTTELGRVSKGDSGEVARAQRKLAEAYELKGDLAKAAKLRQEAEFMRRQIQGVRFAELPDCDLSYAMMNFHAFW